LCVTCSSPKEKHTASGFMWGLLNSNSAICNGGFTPIWGIPGRQVFPAYPPSGPEQKARWAPSSYGPHYSTKTTNCPRAMQPWHGSSPGNGPFENWERRGQNVTLMVASLPPATQIPSHPEPAVVYLLLKMSFSEL
jgi:hypothetical protein